MQTTPGAATDSSDVTLQIKDGIASNELRRPRFLNAITPRLLAQLVETLNSVAADPGVRVGILRGAGSSFCAGFDLKVDQSTNGPVELRAKVQQLHDITRAIRRAPFPLIAQVQGFALGAGCELALCSDIVVAASDATFGFPEVDVALSITGGISHTLPLNVGPAKSKGLVLLGERFTAEEAKAWNLVNFVVGPDELASATDAIASRLAAKPQFALAAAKATLDAGSPGSIDKAFEVETGYAVLTQASTDAASAQTAFTFRQQG